MINPITQLISKLYRSVIYSIVGLRASFIKEQSFRLEIYTCAILVPVALSLHVASFYKLLLIILLLFLLVSELFNSAIEAVVDRISMDIHPGSKFAKDAASAAVGVTVIINAIAWIYVLSQLFP